jgi:hypothetical protein
MRLLERLLRHDYLRGEKHLLIVFPGFNCESVPFQLIRQQYTPTVIENLSYENDLVVCSAARRWKPLGTTLKSIM